ncbi:MAG: response regulator transcription factor [Chloroflexi bacterium]|nr:response regulator transcription factor [Chloroflexota bacterium]
MTDTGRILIIDDEAILRQTLARILQQAGFEATTAESADQAFAFMENTSFDLVYMDLRMPGTHGLDALKYIHEQYPALPVVLFTAQPDLTSALEALRNGATDYLLKPLKPQIVIERARSILVNLKRDRRKREIVMQIEALQAELKSIESGGSGKPGGTQPLSPVKDRFIKCGALTLDLHTKRLAINERVIALPPTSFDYLLVLARHAPDIVQYQTLVAEAQGYQAAPREAQELAKWHIHQLRQAIEQDTHNPAMLINARGMGYRLVAD